MNDQSDFQANFSMVLDYVYSLNETHALCKSTLILAPREAILNTPTTNISCSARGSDMEIDPVIEQMTYEVSSDDTCYGRECSTNGTPPRKSGTTLQCHVINVSVVLIIVLSTFISVLIC